LNELSLVDCELWLEPAQLVQSFNINQFTILTEQQCENILSPLKVLFKHHLHPYEKNVSGIYPEIVQINK
jgi:hypothetical protein